MSTFRTIIYVLVGAAATLFIFQAITDLASKKNTASVYEIRYIVDHEAGEAEARVAVSRNNASHKLILSPDGTFTQITGVYVQQGKYERTIDSLKVGGKTWAVEEIPGGMILRDSWLWVWAKKVGK